MIQGTDVHRNHDCRKIREDPQSRVRKVKDGSVHAAALQFDVPCLFNRGAAEDVGEYAGDRVSRRDEDNRPDGDVEVPAREDAHVEDEDGTLGDSGGSAVEDGRDHV